MNINPMANTSFMLESNKLKWSPLLQQTFYFTPNRSFPRKFSSDRKNLIKISCRKFNKIFAKSSSISSIINDRPKMERDGGDCTEEFKNRGGEEQLFWTSVMEVSKTVKKFAITGVLLGILLLYDHHHALAASGGRMGGRSFSSSSSSSSSSRSYTTRTRAPEMSYSVPYYAPSPFGGPGFYVGPAVGLGSSFVYVMIGFTAFILVSGFLSDRSDGDGDGSVLTATGKTSVLKLQVGLLGLGRSLQTDLNRIAETADTSSPEGLSYVLTETTLALLRHPDYCISGYSFVDVKRSTEAERLFNQLSIEERGKFDEETLVNVNNIRKQSATSQKDNGFRNEYIVITIIVAAEGIHKLPPINGSKELKEALQKLASIPSSRIMAVEVLWTPQNTNDTLSERELLEDYSLLRPL